LRYTPRGDVCSGRSLDASDARRGLDPQSVRAERALGLPLRSAAVSRPLVNVGFYGKLPCRGDFLQRRAPQDFVDVWDAWLQEGLHESRQRLQEAWLNTYLTGRVWRFVLSAGVCGSGVYAGVLVPSVDRVGRYFPLTLIA